MRLVIATPVAVVSGLAAAARAGILIRGGEFLEEIGRLRALAFDKTGTLTQGRPDVVEVVCAPGQDDEDRVVRIAAALGDRGGHVLGKAIARYARGRSLEVPVADDYRAVPGRGARGRVDAVDYHMGSHRYIDEEGLCRPEFHDQLGRAEGAGSVGTAVALTGDSGPMGWIRLADRPRPEAARVLAELHDLGLRTAMLTGDNAGTAAAVASELGVGEQRAGLLPADKVSAIAEIDARHGPTGMVGDGVNDAPALAAAKVSIALGGISSGARAGDRRHRPAGRRPGPAPLADPPQPRHPGPDPPEHRPGPADQGHRPDPGRLRTRQPLDGHRRRRRHQPAGHRQRAAAVEIKSFEPLTG